MRVWYDEYTQRDPEAPVEGSLISKEQFDEGVAALCAHGELKALCDRWREAERDAESAGLTPSSDAGADDADDTAVLARRISDAVWPMLCSGIAPQPTAIGFDALLRFVLLEKSRAENTPPAPPPSQGGVARPAALYHPPPLPPDAPPPPPPPPDGETDGETASVGAEPNAVKSFLSQLQQEPPAAPKEPAEPVSAEAARAPLDAAAAPNGARAAPPAMRGAQLRREFCGALLRHADALRLARRREVLRTKQSRRSGRGRR